MSRPSEPFEASDLRDCASSEAIDRVWSRLEEEVASPRPVRKRPTALIWGAAAAAATFAAGIWVGEGLSTTEHQSVTTVFAEPHFETEPASLQAPLIPSDRLDRVRAMAERRSRTPSRPRSVSPRRTTQEAPHQQRLHEPSPEAEAAVTSSVEPELPQSSSTPEVLPGWQRLANRGEYEAALFELGQLGGFESALAGANAEQLMLLVDVARATGQRQRALAALRRVVTQFPNEPVAPLAAWSLGNLLEKAGDRQGAAEAFSVYRSLSPQGDFAEDALVRQLRGAVHRGDRDSALRLLAQYESEFPEARHADEVLHLRERLSAGEPASVDAGAEPVEVLAVPSSSLPAEPAQPGAPKQTE